MVEELFGRRRAGLVQLLEPLSGAERSTLERLLEKLLAARTSDRADWNASAAYASDGCAGAAPVAAAQLRGGQTP